MSTNNSSLEFKTRLRLFEGIVEAVIGAHSKKIQHRDLGPKNILLFGALGTEEVPKIAVCDFGLGKNWEKASGDTRSGMTDFGTFHYTPPEQHDGLKNVSSDGDVYSLGKLLIFLISGKKPLDPRIAGGFRPLVERATEIDPTKRYETVEDFHNAYSTLKRLLVVDNDASANKEAGFSANDGTVDWGLFHSFGVEGHFESDVYDEYIGIVVDLLSVAENLDAYVAVVGTGIFDTLDVLENRKESLPLNGWPFDSFNRIADIYRRLFGKFDEDDIRFICFSRLWKYAFFSDRYNAQKTIATWLEGGNLPESMHERIASDIVLAGYTVPNNKLNSDRIPDVIKRAIAITRQKEN